MKNINTVCSNCNNIVYISHNEKCPICGQVNDTDDYIDELMVPLIDAIYSKGYKTWACCSSHIRAKSKYNDKMCTIGNNPAYISFCPMKTGVIDTGSYEDKTEYCKYILDKIKSSMLNKSLFTFCENDPDYIFISAIDSFNKMEDYRKVIKSIGCINLSYKWEIKLRFNIKKFNSEWYIAPMIYMFADLPYEYNCYDYLNDIIHIFKQILYEIDKMNYNTTYDYDDLTLEDKFDADADIDVGNIINPNIRLLEYNTNTRRYDRYIISL